MSEIGPVQVPAAAGANGQPAFLQAALDGIREYAIVALDAQGVIQSWNSGAERVYGYRPADALGKHAGMLWPEPDAAIPSLATLFDCVRREEVWDGEISQVRQNGTRFLADVSLSPWSDAAGAAAGFTLVAREVASQTRVEATFQHFLDAAPDAMLVVNADGLIVRVNSQALKLFGYEASELVNQSVDLLVPDAVRGRHAGHRRTYVETPTVRPMGAGMELVGRHRDGHEFPVEISLSPVSLAEGVLIAAAVRDISESRRILRDLRESQEYNRGLIESNIDALMTTDPLGIITDVNRMMCEMTGYAREQLIGTPFNRYFTSPKQADDGIRQVLRDDRVTNYELTMRSRNGVETVVSYNAATFRDPTGRLKGVFAAARDITAQRRLEEELRQTQNYTRGLIEASVDALLTVDPDLVVTDVNEQTARITGFSRDELIGSAFPDYFTDPERAQAGVQQTLAEGFVTDYVLVLRAKDGKETQVSFNASVFKDTSGNVRGIFAAARDITIQKGLEEQFRQAQNYTRGLIESSVDPMITVDPSMTITDVNEQMVRLTEVAKDKLIGSRFDRYFTEPSRAAAGVRKTLGKV